MARRMLEKRRRLPRVGAESVGTAVVQVGGEVVGVSVEGLGGGVLLKNRYLRYRT